MPQSIIPFPMMRPFDLQGHRGARGLYPENTEAGFRAALAHGVATLELDVGMTADGVVVVSHDLRLNEVITRDSRGAWLSGPGPLLRSLSLTELAAYDVGGIQPGTRYAAQFADQRTVGGARIPDLASVLRIDPSVRFNIEMKTDPRFPDWTAPPAVLADAVLAVVEALDVAPRVILESFDWRGPRHVRRTRPAIALAWLTRAETERDAQLWWDGPHPSDFGGSVPRAVAAEGGAIWAPEHIGLSRDLIAEAHALGLQVLVWTVNDPADMVRLVAWGADGLITDRPDLVPPDLMRR